VLLPAAALAGSFKAVPIKVNMSARAKTAVLKVTNDGAEKVTVQLYAREWTQDKTGRDVYKDTKEVIFFPAMAEIKKGEERIVRLGYKGRPPVREKTYRLFIEEMPVDKPGDEMALKFALRLSIPVFVRPPKEVAKSSLAGAELEKGRVVVRVKNGGNAHFVVKKIKARGLDASGKEVFTAEMGGWYVLSGVTRTYALDVPEKGCRGAHEIEVSAEVGEKKMKAKTTVDAARCKRPEEPEEKDRAKKENRI